MGLSETIVAASIGALATMLAAAFQLLTAHRPGKADAKPKRGNTVRSIATVAALMVASAVGGFLYADFRNERTAQDLRSLREELNAKLQSLAATTERLAQLRTDVAASSASHTTLPTSALPVVDAQSSAATGPVVPGSVESVLYAPACDAGSECTEANSRPVALCGAIPTAMQARKFELFIKSADERDAVQADFEQDLGGAKFTGPPNEFPHGDNRKNVCVNFWHWSAEAHIATLVLHYGSPVDVGPSTTPQPASTAVPAAPLANAQTISMRAAKP